MIRESLYFTFDGISSEEFGILNIEIAGSGLMQEPFLAERDIKESRVRGKDKSYYVEVDRKPFEFDLTFAFEDSYDSDKIREVANWLDVDYYKPLIFSENMERIFYAMPLSTSELNHNGMSEGYITIKFRCNSPYSYSPLYETEVYDYSTNTVSGTVLYYDNLGDTKLKPELWVQILEAGGSFKIVNNSNNGAIFELTSLALNETIYIDNENENIETDIPNTYRYDNMTGYNFFELVEGKNQLVIYGKVKVQFRHQFKTKQG